MKIKIVRHSHKQLFVKISDSWNVSIGDVICITINLHNKPITFIGAIKKYHNSQGIGIPQFVVSRFRIKLGDLAKIDEIRKVNSVERPKRLFVNNKIDILSLTPEHTRRGKKIHVDIFKRDGEEYLGVWAIGVKIQFELKRYVDIKIFGNLLGHIQAEGPKFQNNRTPHVAFSNIIISEHNDFINTLRHIGITDDLFYVQCRYDSRHMNTVQAKLIAKKFNKATNIPIDGYLTKRKKGIEFDTYVMGTLLAEILLNSMDKIRNILAASELDRNSRLLAESFLVKLLNGDGTFTVCKWKRKDKNKIRDGYVIQGKLNDGNLEYRKEYRKILEKLGLGTRDDGVKTVYFSCRLENLLYLIKIDAFKGTDNWFKLLYAIKLLTSSKTSHGRSLSRLMELSKFQSFTLRDLSNLGCSYAAGKSWLWNMKKKGYIKESDKGYKLTEKTSEIVKILDKWNNEFQRSFTNIQVGPVNKRDFIPT